MKEFELEKLFDVKNGCLDIELGVELHGLDLKLMIRTLFALSSSSGWAE